MSGGRDALTVGSGILASRLLGLVRQRLFLNYLGASPEADAFTAAFRLPNVLQNLLGEGVLSASFIPAYSRLLEQKKDAERAVLVGAVFGLLSFGTALVVLGGIALAPTIVGLLLPGFSPEQQVLTARLARILFAGAGFLVLSACCLGVLNSHGRFWLSYASPVAWNIVMISALVAYGSDGGEGAVIALAWASLAGSALQVAVQWPAVRTLAGRFRVSLSARTPEVRAVLRNLWPAIVGRGSAQISAYIDSFIASFLTVGSLTILANAQTLYMLPLSLFGMSISASQLPAMSADAGAGTEGQERFRNRITSGISRAGFLVVPSAVAFVVLGDAIVTIVFQGGRFGSDETVWLWGTLAMTAVGLVAATAGRVYASALFASDNVITQQRIALARLAAGATLGAAGALWITPALGLDDRWRVAALALGSAIAAWVELVLLRRAVMRRLFWKPDQPAGGRGAVGTWAAALLAALASLALRKVGVSATDVSGALTHCVLFAVVYGGAALAIGVAPMRDLLGSLRRR
ncbi:MAG: murein biosynthesis integral membrane protein MurJ [Gemmatimonadota bacterium]